MSAITRKFSLLAALVAMFLSSLTVPVLADGHATAIIQPLRFGEVVPIIGSCEMDFNNGSFTPDFNNTCPAKLGSPGQYKIIVEKNTLVRITPFTFTYAGNLFTFTPSGEVTNGVETKALVPNNATIIDSGSTGIIDMKVGGLLNVTVPLTTSNSYIVDLEVDIVVVP